MFDVAKVESVYPEASRYMYKPMLCWKLPENKEDQFNDICEGGEYFAQEKKDGALYQYVKTKNYSYLFSRTVSRKNGLLVNKMENVPHIEEIMNVLPEGTVIIGEIFFPDKTSKDVVSIMGCLPEEAIKRQEEGEKVKFYIYDITFYDKYDLRKLGAEMRYEILKRVCDKYNLIGNEHILLAANVYENIPDYLGHLLDEGAEGIVMKKRNAPYVPDKRPAWTTIKVKKVDYADVVCIGVVDATRDYTGKLDLGVNYTGKDVSEWTYWVVVDSNTEEVIEFVPIGEEKIYDDENCITIPVTKGFYNGWKTAIEIGAYNDNGELIKIGTIASGLNDELREELRDNPDEYIGEVCKIQVMEKDDKELTFRHGFFRGFRDDKQAEECTIRNIFDI